MGRPVGYKMSDESKQKMSEAKKGKARSAQTKDAISRGKRAYKFTEDHINNIRKSNATKTIKHCKYCGEEFLGPRCQKYCNLTCRAAYYAQIDTVQ